MIDCRLLSFGGEENVETAFSVLATYPESRCVVGHFGFDTAYRNHIDILGSDLSLESRPCLHPASGNGEQGPGYRCHGNNSTEGARG